MKKILLFVFCAIPALLISCTPATEMPKTSSTGQNTHAVEVAPSPSAKPAATNDTDTEASVFSVTSSGVVDGVIDSAYGKNGTSIENGIPTLSIPLDISGTPDPTICYALYMDDPDSEPLCGYAWVHWMATNFTQTNLPEGFSVTADSEMVQGFNDSGTVGYAGPTPPDKDHTYHITVYALDAPLDLQDGFSKDQFTAALEDHVLAEATLEGKYKK